MKIFVTGATGFIGSNFLKLAFSEGHEILALRRSEKSMPRVPLQFQPVWLTKELNEVKSTDLEGIDVIVHLAAHSMAPPYDTLEKCMHWNLLAPIKLFNEAIEAGIRKFVVAGSCFEYGLSGEKYEYIPVDAPLKPTSTYAASKAAASTAFYQMAIEKKLELSIHRIFHVFGPGEANHRLWPSLKLAADKGLDFPMTSGKQIRDFIHVDEVIEELWSYCSQNKTLPGKPIIKNLGTGKPRSVLEFSELWWKEWNAKGCLLVSSKPDRENEIMRYVPEV